MIYVYNALAPKSTSERMQNTHRRFINYN
uniref:Rna-binding protein rsf1 n=1 Tax=Triatoma infestans TaxID=30076 RepID=A0A170YMF0_TRIIF